METQDFQLLQRYGVCQSSFYRRLSSTLHKLEKQTRLTPEEFIWLEETKLLSEEILERYHTIEARFYEYEYQQTTNPWNVANASSHWRGANKPENAIALTDGIDIETLKDKKLKSALFTTRGGALRDVTEFKHAEQCARKAIACQPDGYRPYNLMGAIYYDQHQYGEGDRWFEEAIKRGATPNDVDAEIKRIVRRAKEEERQQLIVHLLQKDPLRYAWVKDHKSGGHQQKKAQEEQHPKKSASLPQQKKANIPLVFVTLLDVMKALHNGKQDWIAFTDINKALRKQGCRIEDYQYEKFKPLMLEAEQKGFVKIRQQGQRWDAKLS